MSTSLMKDEAGVLYAKAHELESLAGELDSIRPSEYVLIKNEGPHAAYVGRFAGVVKACGQWRILLDGMGIIVQSEKGYLIGNAREFFSVAEDIEGMSIAMRESTKRLRGGRPVPKEELRAMVKEKMNAYYPTAENPRYIGAESVTRALGNYGLSWEDYRKAMETKVPANAFASAPHSQ